MQRITQKAYAKINIGLDVLRRREDGYHEVRMIMQTVDICDNLILERTAKSGILILTDKEELPVNQDNLIYKAADLLMKEKNITEGVSITLTKRIPIAAGMAGGMPCLSGARTEKGCIWTIVQFISKNRNTHKLNHY